jgi:hypothetical protein
LLAYNSSGTQRTLQITGHNTQINGELIAWKINLQSGAHVKKPKEKSKHKDDDAADIAAPSLARKNRSAYGSRTRFWRFARLRNFHINLHRVA